jgi:hypothetical protein
MFVVCGNFRNAGRRGSPRFFAHTILGSHHLRRYRACVGRVNRLNVNLLTRVIFDICKL